jgi:hypothetical protein
MVDYAIILSRKFNGSQWELIGYDYAGLTWKSETPKPTKKQLDDLWAEVQAEIEAETQAKIDAKATAEGKLAALGLTTDDLRALGL